MLAAGAVELELFSVEYDDMNQYNMYGEISLPLRNYDVCVGIVVSVSSVEKKIV